MTDSGLVEPLETPHPSRVETIPGPQRVAHERIPLGKHKLVDAQLPSPIRELDEQELVAALATDVAPRDEGVDDLGLNRGQGLITGLGVEVFSEKHPAFVPTTKSAELSQERADRHPGRHGTTRPAVADLRRNPF